MTADPDKKDASTIEKSGIRSGNSEVGEEKTKDSAKVAGITEGQEKIDPQRSHDKIDVNVEEQKDGSQQVNKEHDHHKHHSSHEKPKDHSQESRDHHKHHTSHEKPKGHLHESHDHHSGAKPHAHHAHSQQPAIDDQPYNTWKIVSAILFVLLISTAIYAFTRDSSASKETQSQSLTSDEASEKALEYIQSNLLQPGMEAEIVEVKESVGLYNLKLDIAGQEFNSYVSKDGVMLFPSGFNMDEDPEEPSDPAGEDPGQAQPPAPDVVKSDKPEVELFVMSHCPFGTQAEKGMLPVASLLDDKIDFKIKFVYYAMHGKTELDEQLAQYCIQEEQPDKFMKYLSCFLADSNSERCLSEAEIDTDMLSSCISDTDEAYEVTSKFEDKSTWLSGRFPLFPIHQEENEAYSVSGSPTLVLNGQQVSSARSPAAYLAAICGAFNDPPEECEEELSSANPSSGFGYGESDTDVTATCG